MSNRQMIIQLLLTVVLVFGFFYWLLSNKSEFDAAATEAYKKCEASGGFVLNDGPGTLCFKGTISPIVLFPEEEKDE